MHHNYFTFTKLIENFIQKAMAVIDSLAPSKNKRVKGTSQDWFGAELMENMTGRQAIKKIQNLIIHLTRMSIKITIRKQRRN